MSRPSYLPAAVVLLSLLAGFASARMDEPRFAVTSVSLAGPALIPHGQSRQYTIHVKTERVDRHATEALIGAAQPLASRVRPGLYAGDTRLTFADLDFARLRRTQSLQLTLTCLGNEVQGDESGSGAGLRAGSSGRLGLPWWDKPATISARLNNRESNALSILCGEG